MTGLATVIGIGVLAVDGVDPLVSVLVHVPAALRAVAEAVVVAVGVVRVGPGVDFVAPEVAVAVGVESG